MKTNKKVAQNPANQNSVSKDGAQNAANASFQNAGNTAQPATSPGPPNNMGDESPNQVNTQLQKELLLYI